MKISTRISIEGDKFESYPAHRELQAHLVKLKKSIEKQYKVGVLIDWSDENGGDRHWGKWFKKGGELAGQGIKEGLKALDKLDDEMGDGK